MTQLFFYLVEHLKNKQAARKFLNDIDDAKNLLKSAAESFQLCTNDKLRSLGYRKFYLKNSKYFILYRVEENEVFIDDVFSWKDTCYLYSVNLPSKNIKQCGFLFFLAKEYVDLLLSRKITLDCLAPVHKKDYWIFKDIGKYKLRKCNCVVIKILHIKRLADM